MLGKPAVVAASTSPSPANVPPVSATVALVNVVVALLSVSVTAGASVVAVPFSVNAAVAGTRIAGPRWMSTVVVWAVLRLNEPGPSLSTQVTVRVGLALPLLGSGPDAKVTLSSTCW